MLIKNRIKEWVLHAIHVFLKKRGPQTSTITWVSETLHWLLVYHCNCRINNVYNMYFIHYTNYKNIGYVWMGIKIIPKSTQRILLSWDGAPQFWNSWIHHWWLIWPCPNIRTPALGGMKFTILVNPSLVIITLYLFCLIYALE